MIICLIGGIGSGKTISVIKEIVNNNYYPVTNFRLKHKKYHRLRYEDLIKDDKIEKDGKEKTIQRVNWEFWDELRTKHKNFCIFLDEAHNVVHSRTAMSKKNILLSKWISQIRKITSDSPQNHLYIITQTPRRIDVNFRELTQIVIRCEKLEIGEKVIIKLTYYAGFQNYEYGRSFMKRAFTANPYFRYYNTTELVRFKDGEEFI